MSIEKRTVVCPEVERQVTQSLTFLDHRSKRGDGGRTKVLSEFDCDSKGSCCVATREGAAVSYDMSKCVKQPTT